MLRALYIPTDTIHRKRKMKIVQQFLDYGVMALKLDGNNRCGGKEQSLLFDLFKAFDYIENSRNRITFHHECASYFKLPSDTCHIIQEVLSNSIYKEYTVKIGQDFLDTSDAKKKIVVFY